MSRGEAGDMWKGRQRLPEGSRYNTEGEYGEEGYKMNWERNIWDYGLVTWSCAVHMCMGVSSADFMGHL